MRRWSLRSGAGAHQFQSPSSRISEGTSSARTSVASTSTAKPIPTPSCLTKTIRDVQRPHGRTEQQRRGGDDPPGALQAPRDRLLVRLAGVVELLDACEQEHAVVGRERERDSEEQDRLREVDARRLRIPSSPRSRPSWNTKTRKPNAALTVSAFITSAFNGRISEPVIRNRTISVVTITSAIAAGRWSGEARLLVHERARSRRRRAPRAASAARGSRVRAVASRSRGSRWPAKTFSLHTPRRELARRYRRPAAQRRDARANSPRPRDGLAAPENGTVGRAGSRASSSRKPAARSRSPAARVRPRR